MHVPDLKVYTDAASRNNPGPSATAYRIYDSSGKILEEKGEYIGRKETNNVAEYKALISAMDAAAKYSSGEVWFFSDSKIVVEQMSGNFKVKSKNLKRLNAVAKDKERKFVKVTYNHLPREHLVIAAMDRLANKALDGAGK